MQIGADCSAPTRDRLVLGVFSAYGNETLALNTKRSLHVLLPV